MHLVQTMYNEISQKCEGFLIQRIERGNGCFKMVYNNNFTGAMDCVLDLPMDGTLKNFRKEAASFAGTSIEGPFAVLAATLVDGTSERSIRLGKAAENILPSYVQTLNAAVPKGSHPTPKPN